jgi:hypothetical protein
MSSPGWVTDLERRAPDVVACWRAINEDRTPREQLFGLRRALRGRVPHGSAHEILRQQEAVADALESILRDSPDELLRAPGGEEDWNVAQAFAHTTAGRRWLASWAALAARGEWPSENAPRARPSVPGAPDADRQTLAMYLAKSRRTVTAAAADIAGRETVISPFDNPFVGDRLSCGAWLLYTGVHDLMHLDQLHRLAGDG